MTGTMPLPTTMTTTRRRCFPSILLRILFLLYLLPFSLEFSSCLQFCKTNKSQQQRQQQRLYHLHIWKDDLLDDFTGDFDNYFQVVDDIECGRLPREGGGHEHIHCTLIPLFLTDRLAAFYFQGMPQQIFRFRYYKMIVSEDSVEMKLYTLHPSLEQELRATIDPTEWPRIFQNYMAKTATNEEAVLYELPKCNVQWTREMDPIQHSYALEQQQQHGGHHAVMIHGQAIVDSTMNPGQKILIRDELSLWQDEFWIHDRGYNPDTGDYIYGNQRGVPYKLKRVTRIENDGTRNVVNSDLCWTLGPLWRTPEEYVKRMAPINGGFSSK